VKSYVAEVRITPRAGLLDPEGKAIQHALVSLDFEQVDDVRVGRLLRMRLHAASEAAARDSAEAMCRKLLANPVTEDFEIVLKDE
jgi:phosphoribosylformylglycinamidine synthase subunit PurS